MEPEIYLRMARNQREHWWFVARRAIVRSIIKTLHPRPRTLLEVGCGLGGNLAMLSEFGLVCGIESDPEACAHALREAPTVEIHAGALPDDLPFTNRNFDLICLLDVLEHVEDDNSALLALQSCLAPGGRILLTVPAYQWLFGRHDRAHHHFRRYHAGGIRLLAKKSGFAVSRLGYFNTLLFPLAASQRLVHRLVSPAHASDDIPGPSLNRLLRTVFSLEQMVLPRFLFPFGLSVLAILERPSLRS